MWNKVTLLDMKGHSLPVSVSLHMGYLSLFREMLYAISGAGWAALGGFCSQQVNVAVCP